MITEDYVSFETAKLLKEKGFDGECQGYYEVPTKLSSQKDVRKQLNVLPKNWNEYNKECVICEYISIPTHQMALKWLREVHHLQICVSSYSNRWEEYVHGWQFLIKKLTFTEGIGWNWDDSLDAITDKKMSDDITYITYEQAVEAALKYTLENLI